MKGMRTARRRAAPPDPAPRRPRAPLAAAAVLVAAFLAASAAALPPAPTTVSPSVIHIGDPVTVRVRLSTTDSVETPTLPERVDSLEVLGVTRSDSGGVAVVDIRLTTFRTGQVVIPTLPVPVHGASGVDTAWTAPYRLSVESLLPADSAAADSAAFKGLHPPIDLPQHFRWGVAFGYLLVLAALVAFVWWLVRRFRRRPAGAVPAYVPPPRPPELVALEALDAVARKGYVPRGLFKPHYTETTDALRGYIEGRYRIEALDRTSFELLDALRRTALDETHRRRLASVLEDADLVKFARYTPDAARAEALVGEARDWVRETTAAAEAEAAAARAAAPTGGGDARAAAGGGR